MFSWRNWKNQHQILHLNKSSEILWRNWENYPRIITKYSSLTSLLITIIWCPNIPQEHLVGYILIQVLASVVFYEPELLPLQLPLSPWNSSPELLWSEKVNIYRALKKFRGKQLCKDFHDDFGRDLFFIYNRIFRTRGNNISWGKPWVLHDLKKFILGMVPSFLDPNTP